MSAAPEVLCVGETMVVLVTDDGQTLPTPIEAHVGGAESNVAAVLAHLGVRAAWGGRVGDDRFGEMVLGDLARRGIDVAAAGVDPARPTGLYAKHLGPAGTRVSYHRAGSAASAMTPAHLTALPRPSRLAHVTGITPALSPSAAAAAYAVVHGRALGDAAVSVDINHRPALWDAADAAAPLLALAGGADIVFVGLDEAETLWGATTAAEVRALLPGPARVVVKDGARGAWSLGRADGDEAFAPTPPAALAEAVGAGDAFAGGYLAGVLRGGDEAAALRLGHRVAAHAIAGRFDCPELPPAAAILAEPDAGATPAAPPRAAAPARAADPDDRPTTDAEPR